MCISVKRNYERIEFENAGARRCVRSICSEQMQVGCGCVGLLHDREMLAGLLSVGLETVRRIGESCKVAVHRTGVCLIGLCRTGLPG